MQKGSKGIQLLAKANRHQQKQESRSRHKTADTRSDRIDQHFWCHNQKISVELVR